MADKTIGELTQATQIYTNDLFVLSQSGVAKQLSGQLLMQTLAEWLSGKGGIKKIEKTATEGLEDTYTITYANNSTSTYVVTNGAKGDTGDAMYLHIKYSVDEPTTDNDMLNSINNWIGIYSGGEQTAPPHYTSYAWYRIRGDTGNGIASMEENDDYTFTITFTDGTSMTTSVLRGPYIVSVTPPSQIIHGTVNPYTMTMSDGSVVSVGLYAGADGTGAGDMTTSVYDPQGIVGATTGGIAGYVSRGLVASAGTVASLTVSYVAITDLLYENRNPYILIGGTKIYQFALINSSTAYFVCPNRATGAFDWISVTSSDVVDSGSVTYISSIPTGTTSTAGIVQLSTATNSTSTALAATPSAVKSAYDLASAAIPSAQKGTASGVATLTSDSKVTPAQASSKYIALTGGKTLELGDAGCMISVNSSSAETITIPQNSSVAFSVGTEIEIVRLGSGTVTIGGSVTILSVDSKVDIADVNGCVCIKKIDTDTWLLAGDLG